MKRVISAIFVVLFLSCISITAFATNAYSVTSEDTSGLKAILLDILGDYTPVVVEDTEVDADNNITTTNLEVKNDWVWLASFFMLALVVYCIFRLGGVLLSDV